MMIDDLIKGIKASLKNDPSVPQASRDPASESPREDDISVLGDPDKRFYGVVVGRVINPLDPQCLGRVQVQVPFIDSLDLSPWARVAQAMAGPLHGNYFVPNMGENVLVAFENGDVNVPYILGSLANMISRPPLPSPLPQVRTIRTLLGNQIVFEDVPPALTLQSGAPPGLEPTPSVPGAPPNTLRLSVTGVDISSYAMITLEVGLNTINISPAGINLQAGASSINLTPASITLNAPLVSIHGQAVVVKGDATVQIN